MFIKFILNKPYKHIIRESNKNGNFYCYISYCNFYIYKTKL